MKIYQIYPDMLIPGIWEIKHLNGQTKIGYKENNFQNLEQKILYEIWFDKILKILKLLLKSNKAEFIELIVQFIILL